MAPTRWGIASAGAICHDFVNALEVLPDAENHKVVAVAAREEESAKKFAQEFGIAKYYGGYEKLAKDPDVEVVYVGAIHPAHLEIASLMLNNGKHVLCEKPLAMNVRETKQLLALAKEKKLFLMEAMWSRFQPAHQKLREELKSGALGDVTYSHVEFGRVITAARMTKKELGGGTVLDLGIYAVYFSQLVFGGERPSKIVAVGHLNSEGTDDTVSVAMTYSNGRTATFSTHSRVDLPCEGHVYGSKGEAILHFPFWSSQKLTVLDQKHEWQLPKAKRPMVFWNSEGLAYQAQHVRDCLAKGLTESPVVTHAETTLVAEIMEDIRKQVGVEYPQDA